MYYIIDANNLAGRLSLLGEEDFDKKLGGIIKKWLGRKNHEVALVFDSSDPMGDKIKDNNITLIYTPKDNYYKSADDKIVELAEMYDNIKHRIAVITDDIEIKERMKKLCAEKEKEIKLISSTEFSKKINNILLKKLSKNNGGRGGLNKNDIKRINKELLKKWS